MRVHHSPTDPTERPVRRRRILLLVLSLVVVLAACSGGDDAGPVQDTADGAAGAGESAEAAVDAAAGETAGEAGDRAEPGAARREPLAATQQVAAPGDIRDRRVVRTASATVLVDDGAVGDALTQVLRIADRYDAVVTSSTSTGTAGAPDGPAPGAADSAAPGGPVGPVPGPVGPLPAPMPTGDDPRATVTLGVPSGNLEAVMAALGDVGDVAARSVASQDVTTEFIDLEARRDNLTDQAAFYRRLLDASADVEESIRVREELDAVVTQLEQVTGRLRYLERRVELSQLTVSIAEAAAASTAPRGVAGQLADAVGRGASLAVGTLTGIIVAVGAVLPVAAVVAVLAAVGWLVVAGVRRVRPRPTTTATK